MLSHRPMMGRYQWHLTWWCPVSRCRSMTMLWSMTIDGRLFFWMYCCVESVESVNPLLIMRTTKRTQFETGSTFITITAHWEATSLFTASFTPELSVVAHKTGIDIARDRIWQSNVENSLDVVFGRLDIVAVWSEIGLLEASDAIGRICSNAVESTRLVWRMGLVSGLVWLCMFTL